MKPHVNFKTIKFKKKNNKKKKKIKECEPIQTKSHPSQYKSIIQREYDDKNKAMCPSRRILNELYQNELK